MSFSEQTSNDLRVVRGVMHKLGKTFQDFQSYSFSILTLGDQWRTLQNSLATVHKKLEDRLKEIELKERELDFMKNKLQNFQEEVELKQKNLVLEERSWSERIAGVELKERQIKDWFEVLQLKECEVINRLKAVELREQDNNRSCTERISMAELKEREREITEREKEVNQREEKVLKDKEELGLKEKEIDELRNVIECKVKNVHERVKSLVSEVKEQWKRVESKEKQIDERCKEMECKEKEIDEFSRVLKLKEKEIDERCRIVELKEKEVDERCQIDEPCRLELDDECERRGVFSGCEEQDLGNKQIVNNHLTQVKQKLPDSAFSEVESVVDCSSSKIEGDILLMCRSMDTNGVRSFLNEHVNEQNLLQEKILDALRSTPDPAKLVFNVSLSILLRCKNKDQALANKTSCIFLMEQLQKLSPTITVDLRDETKYFAAYLIARLKGCRGNTPADYYGVLQFIATFKLISYNKSDVLFPLLRALYSNASVPEVYRHKQHISLCRELGLLERIPGLIQNLLARQKWLSAVKYICVFKLESEFPPEPLLETRLELLNRKINEKRKDKNSKNAVEQMELSTLGDVIKYITFFKLELKKFSLDSLLYRIKELENNKVNQEMKRKRNAASSCSPIASLERLEKRCRMDNVDQPAPPNGAPCP